MTKVAAAFIATFLTFAASAAAQTEAPKPGPEHEALNYFAGTWKLETEMAPGPFGAGGRVIGSETCEWFPGRMFLVCKSDGTGPMGELHSLAILGYEASQKKYTYYSISNSAGESETATGVKGPDGWTWTSEVKFADKVIHSRFVMSDFTPAGYTVRWDMAEGEKWNTMMTGKVTKR